MTSISAPSDKPSPKDIEIVSESGNAEVPQAEDPQGAAKDPPTAQDVHIDAVTRQPPESHRGADDDDAEEEEEPEEEPEEGPPIPKWRIRGQLNHGVARGTDKSKLTIEERRQGQGRGRGGPPPPPPPDPKKANK
ncbi:hypothetical protein EYR40_007713 [Pleurotus pulmonarius]|nr:hypothetical protein EYR38_007982 [Pleurotus pulmonarius]KAF4597261.1 hypothetical protein EYR40_007713 [Pleurotus pulmonarius]